MTFSAFRKNLYKDLTLKPSTGGAIKIHKVVIVPQSEFLTKIFIKTPKKSDVVIPFPNPIVKAAVRYCYNGSYPFDAQFQSEWNLDNAGKGATDIEFHFKVLQAAAFLGMTKLEELAGNNLKNGLKKGSFGDELFAKLQEIPAPAKKAGDKKGGDKKAPTIEVPFAVTEAIIEGGARTVKTQVDGGVDINTAFHAAARTIDSRYLADFIQAVGNSLGQQFRLYLRCPNCACHIRSKEGGSKDFACIRDDCGKQSSLGELLLDERVTYPSVSVHMAA